MRCITYEPSGYYKGSKLFKESYHVLWPLIYVSKEVAVSTRAETIEFFEEKPQNREHPIALLLKEAKDKNPWICWDNIFDATTIFADIQTSKRHRSVGDFVELSVSRWILKEICIYSAEQKTHERRMKFSNLMGTTCWRARDNLP